MTHDRAVQHATRAPVVVRAECARCGRGVYVHARAGAAHVQHVTCTDLEVLAIEPEGERHARAVP